MKKLFVVVVPVLLFAVGVVIGQKLSRVAMMVYNRHQLVRMCGRNRAS